MQTLQDRHKGGQGLKESEWLVDEDLEEKVEELSHRKGATAGEIFRYALKRGLGHIERNY
jgi:hypothetical protein